MAELTVYIWSILPGNWSENVIARVLTILPVKKINLGGPPVQRELENLSLVACFLLECQKRLFSISSFECKLYTITLGNISNRISFF